MEIQYWQMQMHPTDQLEEYGKYIEWILENKKIIGLGEYDDKKDSIENFKNNMKVNDIVAIKRGKELIALVQIIGGPYYIPRATDSDSRTNWIENRRPIRVLDWAIAGETVPQARSPAVSRCVNEDAETNRIIKDWHERVLASFEKRGISPFV